MSGELERAARPTGLDWPDVPGEEDDLDSTSPVVVAEMPDQDDFDDDDFDDDFDDEFEEELEDEWDFEDLATDDEDADGGDADDVEPEFEGELDDDELDDVEGPAADEGGALDDDDELDDFEDEP